MVLAVVRGFTLPVTIVIALWLLGAMTVALRQALDFKSTVSAALVCAAGWCLILGMGLALGLLFGPALH